MARAGSSFSLLVVVEIAVQYARFLTKYRLNDPNPKTPSKMSLPRVKAESTLSSRWLGKHKTTLRESPNAKDSF
jgi:hypothetical protein